MATVLVLNGVTQASVLFVLASGLTLSFGLMRMVNLAHGAFYLLGGYISFSVMSTTGQWLLAVAAAGLSVALFALMFERLILPRVRGDDLAETLLTIAVSMIIADVLLAVWGGSSLSVAAPAFLAESITVQSLTYPLLNFVIIGTSILIALALWLLIYRTRLGAGLRAGVDDRETAAALGVNIGLLYTLVFMLAGFLAGIAGVLGGTYLQLSPGTDTTILVYALCVVIIGGLGSLGGAVLSALLLGLIMSFSSAYAPEYSMFLVFLPLVIMLAVRPQGFLGRRS
jgi:branched-chain amino acid transport system permease protein